MKKVLLTLLVLVFTFGAHSFAESDARILTDDMDSSAYHKAIERLSKHQYSLESRKTKLIERVELSDPIVIYDLVDGSIEKSNDYIIPIISGREITHYLVAGIDKDGEVVTSYMPADQEEKKILSRKNPTVLVRTDGALIQYAKNSQHILYDVKEREQSLVLDIGDVESVAKRVKNQIRPIKRKSLQSVHSVTNTDGNATYAMLSEYRNLRVPFKANVPVTDEYGIKRGICWAASCASVIDYKTYFDRSAYDIYTEIRNFGLSGIGNMVDKITAHEQYGLNAGRRNAISYSSVKSYINSNEPLVSDFFTEEIDSGHTVVLRGYSRDDLGNVVYSFMDPNESSYVSIDISRSAQVDGLNLYFPYYGMYWFSVYSY